MLEKFVFFGREYESLYLLLMSLFRSVLVVG